MSGDTIGPLVLIVEDELQMRRFLRAGLVANGYRVIEATTASEALSLAPSHNPDLMLLDLGLPDGDGLDVTRRVREWMTAPIIVLSARGREEDKVTTLDAGADDYLTKPFGMAELLARLRVALRHTRSTPTPVVVDIDSLQIDLGGHVVRLDGREVHITPTAFRVLALLAKHAGRVLTHAAILKEVWGPGAVDQTHYVRVQVAELRRAIEIDPARPRYLLTEPGVGYRLRAPS